MEDRTKQSLYERLKANNSFWSYFELTQDSIGDRKALTFVKPYNGVFVGRENELRRLMHTVYTPKEPFAALIAQVKQRLYKNWSDVLTIMKLLTLLTMS